MSRRLVIQCFGVPTLFDCNNGEALTPPQSALGLLVFLSSFGGAPVAREHVIEALWPEASYEKGASRLTSALCRLRKILVPLGHRHAVITLPGGALGLVLSEKLTLDIAVFSSSAQRFLEDESAKDLPITTPRDFRSALPFQGWYAPWAVRERARLELLFERCLRVHMQRLMSNEDYEEALLVGARLLDLDPLFEDVHEDMVDIHLAMDRRALAIRQFRRCANVLRDELDVAPSRRMTEKIKSIYGTSGFSLAAGGVASTHLAIRA